MTDWTRYDVPALASFLTEDDTVSWHQVTAWQHTFELLSEQSVRLAQARAELADAWPPEKSEAASTFISFVDELTSSMNETSEIALTNRTALIGVLSALAEAREAIDGLHARWQAYTEMDRMAALSRVHAAPSQAPPNWRATLNAQAHRKMTETDQIVFENSNRMLAPDVFQVTATFYQITPIKVHSYSWTPNRKLSSGSRISSPVIPAPGGSSPGGSTQSPGGNTSPGGGSTLPPGESPPVTTPPHKPDDSSDSGLPGWPTRVRDAVGIAAVSAAMGAKRITKTTSVTAPSSEPTSDAMESIPPGELIGTPGQVPHKDQRTNKHKPLHRTTWYVSRGISPVITPDPHSTHDPGPGVVGIDR